MALSEPVKIGLGVAAGAVLGFLLGRREEEPSSASPTPSPSPSPTPSPTPSPSPAPNAQMPEALAAYIRLNVDKLVPTYWLQMALWGVQATNDLPTKDSLDADLGDSGWSPRTLAVLKGINPTREWGVDKSGDLVEVMRYGLAKASQMRSPPYDEPADLREKLVELANDLQALATAGA